MRIINKLILVIILLAFTANAQQLKWETVLKSSYHYSTIRHSSTKTVHLLKTWGKYIRSTDAGKTWQDEVEIAPNNFDVYLWGMEFINDSVGVVCGTVDKSLQIFKTINSGKSWKKVKTLTSAGSNSDLNYICSSKGNLWCVGDDGVLLNSKDNGDTWTLKTIASSNDLNAISFADSLIGCICTNAGEIIRTTDAGKTWQVNVIGNNVKQIYAIKFYDNNIGFAAGSFGKVLKTTDAGKTWSTKTISYYQYTIFSALGFSTFDDIWVAGTGGSIYKSLDMGDTWNKVTLPTSLNTESFSSASFFDSNNGYFCGSGVVVKVSENIIESPDNYKTDAVVYIANKKINFYDVASKQNLTDLAEIGPTPNQISNYKDYTFVVNSGTYGNNTSVQVFPNSAFKTYLGNKKLADFQNLSTKVMIEDGGNAYTVCGFSDSLLLVTLAQSKKIQVINFKTGVLKANLNISEGNPQGSVRVNDSTIAVTLSDWGDGLGKYIAFYNTKTNLISKKLEVKLNPVDIIKLKNGNLLTWTWGTWTGDENYGTISVINGKTFELISTLKLPNEAKVSQIIEINDTVVYINGFNADYATVSGLYNFVKNTFTINSKNFWTDNTFYGKMVDGTLIAKNDDNTSLLFTNSGISYNDVLPFSSSFCSAIKYPEVFVKNEENKSKKVNSFEILKNYPNPFNPNTIISYNLPITCNVELKIYDILGKEVTTLVNEKQSIGHYNIRFNANNLPSGIYLARVRSEYFSKTIKMNLIK